MHCKTDKNTALDLESPSVDTFAQTFITALRLYQNAESEVAEKLPATFRQIFAASILGIGHRHSNLQPGGTIQYSSRFTVHVVNTTGYYKAIVCLPKYTDLDVKFEKKKFLGPWLPDSVVALPL